MPGCVAVVWRPSISQDDAEHDLECRKPKAVGEPYEGKPHVRFEVAGGGNQDLGPRRHSLTLPGDGEQRPLVPRFGYQPRLTRGVIAPRKAWRLLQGERPCRGRMSHPPVSSLASMAEWWRSPRRTTGATRRQSIL